jgi:hypothetical protein
MTSRFYIAYHSGVSFLRIKNRIYYAWLLFPAARVNFRGSDALIVIFYASKIKYYCLHKYSSKEKLQIITYAAAVIIGRKSTLKFYGIIICCVLDHLKHIPRHQTT